MAFNEPLNPRDLYWIGYLRADGSILDSRGTLVLGFSQAQLEPVQAFKEYSGIKNEVKATDVRGKSFGKGFKYSIRSVMHANRLAELGTKTILRPDIYLSSDFWRGFCDGDGSVSHHTQGTYSYPAIGFCGTVIDMEALLNWTKNMFGIEASISKAGSIFQVKWAGKKALTLIKHLYADQYSANPAKTQKALQWI